MDFFQQVTAVAVVLGALAALAVFAKRRGLAEFSLPLQARSPRTPKRMQVLERLALSTQHSLHLVNVDGRTVLVGVSPGGCHLLEKNAPEEK